jgi:uncharacterized protein YndB with AHSA1/START domain
MSCAKSSSSRQAPIATAIPTLLFAALLSAPVPATAAASPGTASSAPLAAASPAAPAASTAPAEAARVPAPPERFTQGVVEVTVTRVPEQRLDFEVVVPAGVDAVWQAFTTSEGLVTWLTPVAKVELRLGGPWEAGFPGSKPGGGTILSFLPREILALAALAPESFPTVRRERTQAIFRFELVDAGHTRVRLSQIGWKTGREWDEAFAYLAKGNAQLLNSLYRSFTSGPIDWQGVLGAHKATGNR